MPTDKDKDRATRLRLLFNLSPDEYDRMLAHQSGHCAVTGAPSARLCLDHDHKTGLIRGLIDWRINQALELFRDNPAWLRAAADYIENPPATVALGEPVYGVMGSIGIKVKNRRYGPHKTKTPHPRGC